MNDFKLTVMPGTLPHGRQLPSGKFSRVPYHITIEYKGGRLSISAVVGAKSNGDCWGSCGQYSDGLIDKSLVRATGWSSDNVQKLYDVWEKYHLNDMNPECEHQRAAGWQELAKKEVTLYHYALTDEASKQQKQAEKTAINALRNGEAFTPTPEQSFFASLPYFLELCETPGPPEHYRPFKSSRGLTETQKLGWIDNKKFEQGLLSKPCPECGYKYGSSWVYMEVPEDVLSWLAELPPAAVKCAWGSR